MFEDKFGSQCKLVCLGVGVCAGIIAIYAALAKVGIFAALLLGIAMGVFMALVLMQLFCTGENADLGQMEELPEGSAAAGASAGGKPSGPPKANAPKDRGTPVPNAPVPNPPKPNPPVGSAPEPVLPNKADPLNARTGMGTSAAAAGTDKVAMRAETHAGGNDAATAQDPAFTSASTDAEAGAKVDPAPKAAPKPAKTTKAKPKAKAKAKAADSGEENVGTKPATLDAPRGGSADNLKEIKGVGPKLEGVLHDMGFYHFDQIANWTDQEVAWVDANLIGFKGRVSRDNWIDQAKTLAAGGETEFSKRVDKGNVY
ncbi:hypothetical protein [Roseovarius atlanticus]|uniref:hypothetical protein n=1 Tax=Roseovarius atlanticus TaxID=1641875 RepID=UPI0021BD0A0D|nr:hypothetical protein [Roseovarius atlanticus]